MANGVGRGDFRNSALRGWEGNVDDNTATSLSGLSSQGVAWPTRFPRLTLPGDGHRVHYSNLSGCFLCDMNPFLKMRYYLPILSMRNGKSQRMKVYHQPQSEAAEDPRLHSLSVRHCGVKWWAEFRKDGLVDGARFSGRGCGRPGVGEPFSGYLYGSGLHSRSADLLPARLPPRSAAGVGRRRVCPQWTEVCRWRAVPACLLAVAAAFFAGQSKPSPHNFLPGLLLHFQSSAATELHECLLWAWLRRA